MITEEDTEHEQEKAEEVGFEGLRCLMESQPGEFVGHLYDTMKENRIRVGIEQNSTDGQQIERLVVSDQELQVFDVDEASPQIKVGKVSISSIQIKEAATALNLEVLENEDIKGSKEDQTKISRSSVRRKGGVRELRNLVCTIDFDKGRKEKGSCNNTGRFYRGISGEVALQLSEEPLKEVICKVNPDLVVLQEVKRESIDRNFVASIWRSRFKAWVLLPSIGRSGGILIIWDVRSMKIKESLVREFFVSVLVEDEVRGDWWFIGVCGPSKRRHRKDFWDEITGLKEICSVRWCAGGDFNVVRRVDEKFNSLTNTRSMREFDLLIDELELVDPNLTNARFTWSNFRQFPICCRLDRFFFTNEWAAAFQCYRQEVEVRPISDHSPLFLDTSPPKWGPTPFRFENAWLEHKLFRRDFEKWWQETSVQGWEGYKWMQRLQKIKPCLKKWNNDVFGDVRVIEAGLNNRLLELDTLESSANWNEDLRRERAMVKKELNDIMVKKEIVTMQKLKVQWAKEGDANSGLFHRLLNARKSKNLISKIEMDNGEVLTREEDMFAKLSVFMKISILMKILRS